MSLRGTRIYNDRDLLKFKTFEEYLDSLVTPEDLGYLRSTTIARQIAELGYRWKGETLNKTSFYKRLKAARNLVYPVYKPYTLSSELSIPTDSLQLELALRERENRLGSLSTIIFLRYYIESQFEISGYIDYAHRLETEDWLPFFQGKKKLRVRNTDLGYYNWKTGKVVLNETLNYQPLIDSKRRRELVFKNFRDRHIIHINPFASSQDIGTTRVDIRSEKYEHVVMYDHLLRSKL